MAVVVGVIWGHRAGKGEDRMIVAVPAELESVEEKVCASFGRASFFCLYDDQKKEVVFRGNEAVAQSGGAGVSAAQSLVDHHVDVLITFRVGENAIRALQKAGIKVLKAIEGSIRENIDAFSRSMLFPLEETYSGYHHGS